MPGPRQLTEFGFTAVQQTSVEAIHGRFASSAGDWQRLFARFLRVNKRIAGAFAEVDGRLVARTPLFAALMRFSPFFQLVVASHRHVFSSCDSVLQLKEQLGNVATPPPVAVPPPRPATPPRIASTARASPPRYVIGDLPAAALHRILAEAAPDDLPIEVLKVGDSDEGEDAVQIIAVGGASNALSLGC